MTQSIQMIPFHPQPDPKTTIGKWIETLANANQMTFRSLFRYIKKHAIEFGIVHTLSYLTGFSINEIDSLENEFKDPFPEKLNTCPIKGCDHSETYEVLMFRHLSYAHDLGIQWYTCPYCDYKAKKSGHITQHLRHSHNIGIKWYECPQCDYRAKIKGNIRQHLANSHGIGVKWHECSYCDYRSKNKSHLTRHLATQHDIRVVWHECELCDFKTKYARNLKSHIRAKHSIPR